MECGLATIRCESDTHCFSESTGRKRRDNDFRQVLRRTVKRAKQRPELADFSSESKVVAIGNLKKKALSPIKGLSSREKMGFDRSQSRFRVPN